MADTLGGTLVQKAGPLPVWAWAGLGTAGLAAFLYYRQKKQTTAAAQQQNSLATSSNLGTTALSNLTQSASPMPIQMGDTFVDQSQGQSQGQTQGQDQAQAGPGGTASASTTAATTSSVSGVNPGGVMIPAATSTSTSKATATTPTPMKAPQPPTKVLPPAPKPAPPPPPPRTVTVCPYPQWCGSLWGIAQHFYGNGALWTQIYNANKGKIGANPNLIHVGTVLTIP